MDVMSKLKEIGALVRISNYLTALDNLQKLWNEIPEPKVDTPNSYLVLEYAVACSIKVKDLDEAQRWAALAPDFAQKRQDRGEVEFLVGKVAFERGELQVAKENFRVSDAKSRGRIFEGEDPKYKQLIQ